MLAIVMTAGEDFPGNAVLAKAIKARAPNIVIPENIVADPNSTLVFLYEDYMFAVGKVDASCPISKDDPCVQFAWYWPDAWGAVSKHKAHLLPSVSGDAAERSRSLPFAACAALLIARRRHAPAADVVAKEKAGSPAQGLSALRSAAQG
jgi:hypothetical protein